MLDNVSRNSAGMCVSSYLLRLGCNEIIVAELPAIFHGVKLSLDKSFIRIIIEFDSKEAKHYIQHGPSKMCHYINLLVDIARLTALLEVVEVSHIYMDQVISILIFVLFLMHVFMCVTHRTMLGSI